MFLVVFGLEIDALEVSVLKEATRLLGTGDSLVLAKKWIGIALGFRTLLKIPQPARG